MVFCFPKRVTKIFYTSTIFSLPCCLHEERITKSSMESQTCKTMAFLELTTTLPWARKQRHKENGCLGGWGACRFQDHSGLPALWSAWDVHICNWVRTLSSLLHTFKKLRLEDSWAGKGCLSLKPCKFKPWSSQRGNRESQLKNNLKATNILCPEWPPTYAPTFNHSDNNNNNHFKLKNKPQFLTCPKFRRNTIFPIQWVFSALKCQDLLCTWTQ